MRLDKYQLGEQQVWALSSLTLFISLAAWYGLASRHAGEFLQGGSLPALVSGIVAGIIVLFELLLGMRKRFRARRLMPARIWLAAHLWLGLATLPLAILHSGFRFGGWLPSILLFLLALTYASGLLGWALQHFIPPIMLKALPAETITSEIDSVSSKNLADLRQMLTNAFGPSPQLPSSHLDHRVVALAMELESWTPQHALSERALTIGAMRDSQRLSTLPAVLVEPASADAERIWQAYNEILPYALRGQASGSRFSQQAASNAYFTTLALACNISTSSIIAVMQSVCDQRRQFDLQRRLNGWMVGWIPLHVALASALGVLLVVHVVTALRYW